MNILHARLATSSLAATIVAIGATTTQSASATENIADHTLEDHGRDFSADDGEDQAEPVDDPRLRIGFNLLGGAFLVPVDSTVGAGMGVALRVGLQVNRWFAVAYQNTPMVTLLTDQTDNLAAGFLDYNTVLASFTPARFLDISLGPSVDYLRFGVCGEDGDEIACGTGSFVRPGGHGRLALQFGSRANPDGRRSAFTLGADVHPVWFDGKVLMSITGGLGGEWF